MMPKHNLKICPVCGRVFSPRKMAVRQVYHHPKCQKKARYYGSAANVPDARRW